MGLPRIHFYLKSLIPHNNPSLFSLWLTRFSSVCVLSLWKAFFGNTILSLISVSYFSSFIKIISRYLKLSTCMMLSFPSRSLHRRHFLLTTILSVVLTLIFKSFLWLFFATLSWRCSFFFLYQPTTQCSLRI